MSNDIKHGRFKGVDWYPRGDVYTLVGGAGGIGSWLTFLLARAGFKPIVFDFDVLEEHNMSGQLYSKHMIGMQKVDAIKKIVDDFCSMEITVFNEAVTEETFTNPIVFSAFDNMMARQVMFSKWRDQYQGDPNALFIDGRLTAEQMQIFCVVGSKDEHILTYQNNYLFDDAEVEDAPCTVRQTSGSAAMIASHMNGFFTNHMSNVYDGSEIRTVPFSWEYFIPMDLLTT